MTSPVRIQIPKRPQTVVPFELESPDGDVEAFTWTAPKRAVLALDVAEGGLRQVTSLLTWLERGLPDEQAGRLEERLRDPDDDLDVETLAELARQLIEQGTARPTAPPSA